MKPEGFQYPKVEMNGNTSLEPLKSIFRWEKTYGCTRGGGGVRKENPNEETVLKRILDPEEN